MLKGKKERNIFPVINSTGGKCHSLVSALMLCHRVFSSSQTGSVTALKLVLMKGIKNNTMGRKAITGQTVHSEKLINTNT